MEKRGYSWRLVSREGVFWSFSAFLNRPLLVFGFIFFVFMTFYIPSRVFFIQVQGNTTVQSNRILNAASDLGIRFGAARRLVKSEQAKNGLLSAIEELEWAGVNTKGCVAVISVREHPLEEKAAHLQGVGDVVALRDGVILNCDATRGNVTCTPGQAVKSGDILISGTFKDGPATVSMLADGEVFASTERVFSAVSDGTILKRGPVTERNEKFSLLVGKKLINFFKCSGISGGTCVKMYSKYVLTLPGGFCLPVALIKYSFESYELSDEHMDPSRAQKLLSDFTDQYIRDQMVAGRILASGEQMRALDGGYQLTGTYACTEMIGRVQQEQIGAYNGKTD